MEVLNVIRSVPRTRPWEKRTKPIDQVVIHHTAEPDSFDSSRITPDMVAGWHMDPDRHLVMPSIAYHYLIATDGRIWHCNDDRDFTWHGNGSNDTGIGVCLAGNFMNHWPLYPQLQAAHELIQYLRTQYGPLKVIGHKEAPRASTACPGDTWSEWRGVLDAGPNVEQQVRARAWRFGLASRYPEDVRAFARVCKLGAPLDSILTLTGVTAYGFAFGIVAVKPKTMEVVTW